MKPFSDKDLGIFRVPAKSNTSVLIGIAKEEASSLLRTVQLLLNVRKDLLWNIRSEKATIKENGMRIRKAESRASAMKYRRRISHALSKIARSHADINRISATIRTISTVVESISVAP